MMEEDIELVVYKLGRRLVEEKLLVDMEIRRQTEG